MDWWLWILIGLALLGAEALTPGGLVMLFFGIGAIAAGAVAAAVPAGGIVVEGITFSIVSIVSLLAFRSPLLKYLSPTDGRAVDAIEGEYAVLLDDLPPGGIAKAELRGASWSARSASDKPIARGRRCRVERIEGLTLWIEAEA